MGKSDWWSIPSRGCSAKSFCHTTRHRFAPDRQKECVRSDCTFDCEPAPFLIIFLKLNVYTFGWNSFVGSQYFCRGYPNSISLKFRLNYTCGVLRSLNFIFFSQHPSGSLAHNCVLVDVLLFQQGVKRQARKLETCQPSNPVKLQ